MDGTSISLWHVFTKDFFPLTFVGLSFYTTEQGLSEAFSQYGQVIEGDYVLFVGNYIEYPLQASSSIP